MDSELEEGEIPQPSSSNSKKRVKRGRIDTDEEERASESSVSLTNHKRRGETEILEENGKEKDTTVDTIDLLDSTIESIPEPEAEPVEMIPEEERNEIHIVETLVKEPVASTSRNSSEGPVAATSKKSSEGPVASTSKKSSEKKDSTVVFEELEKLTKKVRTF